MIKKIILLVLLVLAGGLLWFMWSPKGLDLGKNITSTSTNNSSAKPKMRIVLETNYPPYLYLEANNRMSGYEVDIVRGICSRIKRECAMESQDWSKIITSVKRGKYDMGVGAISITDKRKKIVDFSEPYAFPNPRFMGNVKINPRFINLKTPNEIRDYFRTHNMKVGVQTGTTMESYLRKKMPSVKLKRYDSSSKMQMDLSYGRVSAILIELGTEIEFKKNLGPMEKADFVFFGPKLGSKDFAEFKGGIAAIFQKGSYIRKDVNKAIEDMKKSGYIRELSMKYFGYNISDLVK